MSDAVFDMKASAFAAKNDNLRAAFALDDVRCFLLKRGEHTSVFSEVVEVTAGYRVKDGLFTWADPDLDVRDNWAEATHIAYGVPNSGDEIEIYGLDEKTTVDPDVSDVYWRAILVNLPNERFEVTA